MGVPVPVRFDVPNRFNWNSRLAWAKQPHQPGHQRMEQKGCRASAVAVYRAAANHCINHVAIDHSVV